MKRAKIIKELEGQKLHIEAALANVGVDRTKQEIFEQAESNDAYWYGRLITIEETLRFLRA